MAKGLERIGKLRGRPWVSPGQWSQRSSGEAFLATVRGGSPAPMSAYEARRSLELVAGLSHSALSGRVVRFPLDRTFPNYDGIRSSEARGARGG
jgi:hypothetical protein